MSASAQCARQVWIPSLTETTTECECPYGNLPNSVGTVGWSGLSSPPQLPSVGHQASE
jgi:hypothetical protein